MNHYIEFINKNGYNNINKQLIGNKGDLNSKRAITYWQKNNMKYIEISCKEHNNIKQLLDTILEELIIIKVIDKIIIKIQSG